MRGLRRSLFVVASLLFATYALALALPADAVAKTRTFIKGTPSASAVITKPVSHKISGKLTYAKGGKRLALKKQQVRVYRFTSGKWKSFKKVRTTNKGKFSAVLPSGYRYQVRFAGSRKYKACSSAKFRVRRPVVAPPTVTPPTVTPPTVTPPTVTPPVANPTLDVRIDPADGEYTQFLVDEGVWGSVTTTATGGYAEYLPGVVVKVGNKTAITDAYGYWSVGRLAAGDYAAQVVAGSDYVYRTVHYQLRSNAAALSVVEELDKYVYAETDQERYETASSGDTASISGVVRVAEYAGAPVPGVRVGIYSYEDGARIATSLPTNADGEWSVADVPVGEYWTCVEATFPFEFDSVGSHHRVAGSYELDFEVGVGPFLWEPSPGAVPLTGNYVYLDSDPGDYIGQGHEYLYTPSDTQISVSATGGHLSVRIDGDEWWYGDFVLPNSLSQLTPGYYPGLTRYPFHDAAQGGLSWSGEGRGSNTLTGWIVVDDVTYENGVLTSIDLRFEQHSEGGQPALNGAIRWSADDVGQPDGPVNPIPNTLWMPSAAALPVSGNYVYLDSDPGDYIGQGHEYLYTAANSQLSVTASGGLLSVSISGDDWWYGRFQTMNTLSRLETGYYPDLSRHPFHNPAKGGLSWSGEGRGSNTLTGWFAVDSVTYENGVLKSIDLRFEQHSEGGSPALHGAIHWRAGS